MKVWWNAFPNGTKEFNSGKEAWAKAAAVALTCSGFVADVEEEWAADDPRSCYNCRYRRWSVASFTCQWGHSPPGSEALSTPSPNMMT